MIQSTVSVFGQDVLLSIKRPHADRLFSYLKTFEIRKMRPRIVPRRIFLFESEGAKRIIGHIVVERIIEGSPSEVWKMTGIKATTEDRFFEYFGDRDNAFAYEVSHAVKYSSPLMLADILSLAPQFNVPQSFIYLSSFPELHKKLAELGFSEALNQAESDVRLRTLRSRNIEDFKKLTEQHISNSYKETGRAYAEKLLEIDNAGGDAEGVITISKQVLEVVYKDKLAGYIVLTEKAGGSLKTGPTILRETFTRRGIGSLLRGHIHKVAASAGYRKVYCTVPCNKYPAINYLLNSGYQVEAHLRHHYHEGHDELVFGFLLSRYREFPPNLPKTVAPVFDYSCLTAPDAEVSVVLDNGFAAYYCQMPSGWADSQIRQAAASTKGSGSSFKPRLIFVARGLFVGAVALCVFKRGGSAKILILSAISDEISLINFVGYIENYIAKNSKLEIRKVYSHVAVNETELFEVFIKCGYRIEGLLQQPYNAKVDMYALGKELKRGRGISIDLIS